MAKSSLVRSVEPPDGEFSRAALERVTGSAEIRGNAVSLQFDGPSTFSAWLEAIEAAQRFVHFENYVLRDDRVGRKFREVLVRKARDGVQVRVLYDWVGCWATPRKYWKPFRAAGVEVRAFNRPSVRDPLGVLQRDHRKLVCVDGTIAFVGGFCIGIEWAGTRDEPPWRDTGLEVRGPAAAQAALAFERIWSEEGDRVPEELADGPETAERVGDCSVWLIEGEPWRARVQRTLQFVAASVRQRLWITDPYFVAPRSLSDALAAAARQGVDVRVLVPATNNWPLVGSLSRGGYRPLLHAGVRLFEWQGPMIHAKTSVADGMWCRVGSSNLNSASLLGNWEIDVGVMDASLAGQLEGLFMADLASSVEIVLPGSQSVHTSESVGALLPHDSQSPLDPEGTLASRLEAMIAAGTSVAPWHMAQLVRAGTTFGGALAGRRTLGREDRTVLGTVSVIVLAGAVLTALFPVVIGWALAVGLGWIGVVMAVRALAHRRRARIETLPEPGDTP
ncbi:MAG: phosphatidylserine/phosphatidylglycerophosphate/cardiolipin synthase family protein [Longimicrobiales bacterium]